MNNYKRKIFRRNKTNHSTHPYIHIALYCVDPEKQLEEENVDYFILITHFKPQFISNKSGKINFDIFSLAVNTLSFPVVRRNVSIPQYYIVPRSGNNRFPPGLKPPPSPLK